jgi:hypothetical protein
VTLYHYTCDHAAGRISRRGFLRPSVSYVTGIPALVWLTDLADPDARALGLERLVVGPRAIFHGIDPGTCNRLAHRYEVNVDDALHWQDFARTLPQLSVTDRAIFEDGRKPEHWFVIGRPVFAIEDLRWKNRRHALARP